MTMFTEAKNEQGFLKANFLGFPGSGKTFTSAILAQGIYKLTKSTKPVYAIDTEKGFDYLVDHFEKSDVPLRVARIRAFSDIMAAFEEAEREASVVIIDSVTHAWLEIQSAYKFKTGRQDLRMQDWGPIKSQWAALPNKFLNSKVHAILCGRAGDDLETTKDEETGRLEIRNNGVKMLAEKNLGYEPGLVCEMERVNLSGSKKGKREIVNRVHILKDRFDIIDGQSFDDPTFETFLPHIQSLNLGGEHSQIAPRSSAEMFDDNSDKNFYAKRKKIEILKEEIAGELESHWPGRTADATKAKSDICNEIFKTRSWAALDEKEPIVLFDGLNELKKRIEAMKNKTKEVLANATKEGK